MRILVRTIIWTILLLAVFSCARKAPGVEDVCSQQNLNDSDFVHVNIENVLLNQVLHGYQCEAVYKDSSHYLFTNDDMLALGDVLADEMKKMGLELNPQLFLRQMKKTHGIEINGPAQFSLYESRMLLYMVPELHKPEPVYDMKINLSDSRLRAIEDVIFDTRVGLMYPALFIPEVIDYTSRFPIIKDVEDAAVMPRVNGEKIKKWRDETSLASSRKELLNMIYHINNYVLYENRESLDWLVKNCMSVLQAMFVDFRMEHEPIIDSLVLVRTRSGKARLEALFAERNEDGSVYIRKGLLEYISQNERLKAPRFQTTIKQYVAGCFGYDIYYDRTERFPNILVDNFTLEERRMIVANIMNVVFSLYSGVYFDKIMNVILNNDPGFIDDTVEKKYYGFENLCMGISIYRMKARAEKWKTITQSH